MLALVLHPVAVHSVVALARAKTSMLQIYAALRERAQAAPIPLQVRTQKRDLLFLACVCGKAFSCTQERPEPFFILPPDGTLHVIHELARCKIQAFLALLVHMVSVPEMLMATGHAKDPVEYLLPISGAALTVTEYETGAEVLGMTE